MQIQFAERFTGITGSEIRKIFALLSDPEMISLAGGNPSPKSFPSKKMAELSAEIIEHEGEFALQYGNTPGISPLIELIKQENQDILRPEDDVLILSGSSQGIDFAARTLLDPGDAILVESPTFLGALQTFMIAQADIHEVAMCADGMDLTDLEDKLKKYSPKFVYTIPTFQNPSGLTTSAEKRKAIYELCAKYHALILEDDPYCELRYEGEALPSIKSFDRLGIVIKLMSYSKTISPGLRVGAVLADREIVHEFNLCKQGADVHTSNLSQYLVYEYIRRGYLAPHIQEIRAMYKQQRDVMLEAVENCFPKEVCVNRPMGGLFVWCELPGKMDAKELFAKCVERKVAFVPGGPFYARDPHKNTLRLNFSMPSKENIQKGIAIIGEVIKENL